ncbi:MAG: hypothetical protein FD146_555 [Anaerolineaceae bacterium]|nr:MAG: hypothetical protein FD146_555 [Anaerolineaceae bacterium]
MWLYEEDGRKAAINALRQKIQVQGKENENETTQAH